MWVIVTTSHLNKITTYYNTRGISIGISIKILQTIFEKMSFQFWQVAIEKVRHQIHVSLSRHFLPFLNPTHTEIHASKHTWPLTISPINFRQREAQSSTAPNSQPRVLSPRHRFIFILLRIWMNSISFLQFVADWSSSPAIRHCQWKCSHQRSILSPPPLPADRSLRMIPRYKVVD